MTVCHMSCSQPISSCIHSCSGRFRARPTTIALACINGARLMLVSNSSCDSVPLCCCRELRRGEGQEEWSKKEDADRGGADSTTKHRKDRAHAARARSPRQARPERSFPLRHFPATTSHSPFAPPAPPAPAESRRGAGRLRTMRAGRALMDAVRHFESKLGMIARCPPPITGRFWHVSADSETTPGVLNKPPPPASSRPPRSACAGA
jgi:hypothetical protein